jgi:phosphate transport system ATP-binding protein
MAVPPFDPSAPDKKSSEVNPEGREAVVSRDAKLIQVIDFDFFYGTKQALSGINLEIPEREITAFIGPSGRRKTTLLRSINRLSDLVKGSRHNGDIKLRGESVFQIRPDVISLRKRIGMVFQKTNPFQKSVYENVVFGLRIVGQNNRRVLDEIVLNRIVLRQLIFLIGFPFAFGDQIVQTRADVKTPRIVAHTIALLGGF